MPPAATTARANQVKRTRKDLLRSAAQLLREGRKPSLEEVAEAALVSRATAYRYFPNIEALIAEAVLDMEVPEPAELFADEPSTDPVTRVERVDALLHDMSLANEPALRIMLANALQNANADDTTLPARQNRRSPLIEAALAPARDQLDPSAAALLEKALALIIGTEAIIVFKDVLRTSDAEARAVKRWAIRALIAAARRPPQ